jgi:GNAT superfamily N-acetyltransferase
MRGRWITVLEVETADGQLVRYARAEEWERLPAPAPVPDVEADIAAAIEVRRAHERRGFGRAAVAKAGSTLRLPGSRRAA